MSHHGAPMGQIFGHSDPIETTRSHFLYLRSTCIFTATLVYLSKWHHSIKMFYYSSVRKLYLSHACSTPNHKIFIEVTIWQGPGVALLVEWSRDRSPVVSLGIFFRGSFLQNHVPWGRLSLWKMRTRDFSWGKGGRWVWLTTYQPCSAESREDPGP